MSRNSYCKDINGFDLYEGDIVWYVVKRCSPNSSSWGKIKSKNDGYYKVRGTICFERSRFIIKGDKDDIEKLAQPISPEQGERNVWFDIQDLGEYIEDGKWGDKVIKEFNSKDGYGYIEKIGKKRKKKKVNNRLKALGIA